MRTWPVVRPGVSLESLIESNLTAQTMRVLVSLPDDLHYGLPASHFTLVRLVKVSMIRGCIHLLASAGVVMLGTRIHRAQGAIEGNASVPILAVTTNYASGEFHLMKWDGTSFQ